MKKLHFLFFTLVFISLEIRASDQNILSDPEFCSEMMLNGISFQTLRRAYTAQDPDAIQDIIAASLDTSYLFPLLEQHSNAVKSYFSTHKKVLTSLILENALDPVLLPLLLTYYQDGEDSFYKECQDNPYLFKDFFAALTAQLLQNNPFLLDHYAHCIEHELTTRIYLPYEEKTLSSTLKSHFHTSFMFFKFEKIKIYPVIYYLRKLLELEFPTIRLSTRNYSDRQELKALIAFFAPLFRGDLFLLLDKDPDNAYKYYKKAKLPQILKRKYFLMDLKNRRLGELELNVFKGIGSEDYVNVALAIRRLDDLNAEKNYADMRLAEYYLGLIDPNIHNFRKAHQYLERNRNNEIVNHIVCQIEMDYYLGLGHPDGFNQDLALESLERGLESSEEYPALQKIFFSRKGEMLLGLYGEGKNVESAIPILEKSSNYFLLYLIYSGFFGKEYKNSTLKNDYFEAGVNEGHEMLILRKSYELIKEGQAQEALDLLDSHKVYNIHSTYVRARLYVNKNLEIYDPINGLRFLAALSSKNYRDSKKRLIKFVWTLCTEQEITKEGLDFFLSKIGDNFSYDNIFQVVNENIEEINMLILDDRDDFLEGESREEVVVIDQNNSAVEPNLMLLDSNEALEVVPSMDQDFEGNDQEITISSVKNVNNDGEIVFLSESIEFLMENLGGNIVWTREELWPYLIEMGAEFRGKQLSFPGVEGVFNYHKGHKGTNEFSLSRGYWKYLKRMIWERYDILIS